MYTQKTKTKTREREREREKKWYINKIIRSTLAIYGQKRRIEGKKKKEAKRVFSASVETAMRISVSAVPNWTWVREKRTRRWTTKKKKKKEDNASVCA